MSHFPADDPSPTCSRRQSQPRRHYPLLREHLSGAKSLKKYVRASFGEFVESRAIAKVGLRLPNDQLVSINAEAATRDLSPKRPGFGPTGRAKVRAGVLAQLDCFLFTDNSLGVPHVNQASAGLNAYAHPMLFSLRSSDRPGPWLSAHSSSAHTRHTTDLTRVMDRGTYGFRRLMASQPTIWLALSTSSLGRRLSIANTGQCVFLDHYLAIRFSPVSALGILREPDRAQIGHGKSLNHVPPI